jgi:2-dehydropantoate 2-reductase
MGCLFAAKLAKGGVQTTLVDYRPERAARLQKSGITVEEPGGTFTAKPTVTARMPDGQHLIIILTKAHSLKSLQFRDACPILTLQNGLGNIETLCSMVGSARVLAGTTCEASTLLSDGHVRRVAPGITAVGSWTSCQTKIATEAFEKAGFQVEITDAPGQRIWEKVAISAAINPLTALLGVPNGKLLELREVRQLMRDLVVETAKVAATEGYKFGYSLVERTEEVCRETADNISSMLQDVRAGKRTEIDAISGEILRRAQLASLPTPRTRVVWQIVKGLEQR